MRVVWGLLPLVAVCVLARLAPAPAEAAEPAPVTFTEVGTHTYTVPTGYHTVHVVAVGAAGGDNSSSLTGGLGAVATANLAVTPGQTLNVYVGGRGESVGKAAGGFNGGGTGQEGFASGGGGASDVRTGSAAELTSRLIVAGGGGGASNTGKGGAAEEEGSSYGSLCTGGGAGTSSAGGSGGKGSAGGGSGTLGNGGSAAGSYSGGGGGGGLYGGGAGGGYLDFGGPNLYTCSGGGGSSGFGPGATATSIARATTTAASVTITVVPDPPATPGNPTAPPTGGGNPGGGNATALTLSLSPNQEGRSVDGTVTIPANRSSLKAKIFLGGAGGTNRLLAAKKKVVGSLTEAALKKGLHSFSVKLNRKGKKALKKLGKLKLTLEVKVIPPQGAVAVATKKVKLKP